MNTCMAVLTFEKNTERSKVKPIKLIEYKSNNNTIWMKLYPSAKIMEF